MTYEKFWQPLAYARHDLSRCDQEPIKNCGAIQAAGYFLALDAESTQVIAVSENLGDVFHVAPENLLGQTAASLFSFQGRGDFSLNEAIDHSQAGAVALQISPAAAPRAGQESVAAASSSIGSTVYATFSMKKGVVGVDFESTAYGDGRDAVMHVERLRRLVLQVDAATELDVILQRAVVQLRQLTAFDRVMIYKFEANHDGIVVAEDLAFQQFSKLGSYLGLHYPASDIPESARKLYLETRYRMIIDAQRPPVRIVTRESFPVQELDLSESAYRAVSPFHIEYLNNMGVRASFSVPLKVNGKLWGLIACHHYSKPMHLTRELRSAWELAGQVLSGRLTDHINERRLRLRTSIAEISQNILSLVTAGDSAISAFAARQRELLDLTQSGGGFIRLGGEEIRFGTTPSRDQIEKLLGKMQQQDSLSLWKSVDLKTDADLEFNAAAVGALAVPLSLGFEDVLIWFRPEVLREVTWGGRPPSEVEKRSVLTPRASFEAWVDVVRGKAKEWNEGDQEAAQYLLFTFVKGIFQKAADLSRANVELERVTQAKDEFIGLVSHELRTPLGVMIGWIDILKDEVSQEPGVQQALEIIERNAKLQINLINDLLDISRIISGKMRLSLETNVDLGQLVGEVIMSLRPTALAKGVTLKFDGKFVERVSTDPERMRQVIWNLVSNSIKFTPKGGEVEIAVRLTESAYQITVRDTGIGIAPEQLGRIFERFAQTSDGHAKMGGLGLGLSIVKSLVELHGGHIEASSAGADRGALFTATFPIFSMLPDVERSFSLAKKAAPVPEKELKGLRILLAEDQADGAEAIRYVLERYGADVDVCYDGASAFAKLEAGPYDLLLSDIGMPICDGYALIRQLRELEERTGRAAIPALAMTAYATSADRVKCLEAGFQNHIAKPVDRSELLAVIRALKLRKEALS